MEIHRSGDSKFFSDFVAFDNIVTTRGVTALDQSRPIKEQTEDCLRQIDALLASAGTSKERLLTSTVYISDMANKDGMNAAWGAWVHSQNRPTRATVQTPLATAKTLVEIVVSAAL